MRTVVRLASVLLVMGLLTARADAASVTLAWAPNSETDLAGYVVAFGTAPGRDDVIVDVGKVTTWTFTNAMNGVTYYFRVRAYNTAGQRSGPSAEVSTTVFGPPPAVDGFSVDRGQLIFGAARAGTTVTASTPPQGILVTNKPGVTWTASSNQPWMSVSPGRGTGSGPFSVNLVNGSVPGPGIYEGVVTVTSSGNTMPVLVRLRVHAAGTTTRPVGAFDTPMDGAANVVGAIPVTGWALDDVHTTAVAIYREPAGNEPAGNGYIFLGHATFVADARPDVESFHTHLPMRNRAGWGFMLLTNMLPDVPAGTASGGNGTFRLHAYAIDAEANVTYLGGKRFTAANRHATVPFGTIDTPPQGGTISGSSYVNFGWALSPLGAIPTNGSTITVYIDGVAVGHPTYNNYRPDIASTFPGYANSNGAVGYYVLDTTKLLNGIHTISWVATDNLGNTAGLGSRFFTVANTTGAGSSTAAQSAWTAGPETSTGSSVGQSITSVADVQLESAAVEVARPAQTDQTPEVLFPSNAGEVQLQSVETDLIEVRLASRFTDTPGVTYEGYLVVGGEMRSLPAGSSLDSTRGVFSWQPGAGFIGAYEFIFLRTMPSGGRTKVPVRIHIDPRFDRVGERNSRIPRDR